MALNEANPSDMNDTLASYRENCSFLQTLGPGDNISNIDPNHPCVRQMEMETILYAEEEWAMFEGPPWWCHLLVQILYVIVCLIGLAGNTLVIYVVVRFSKMQTVTNLYIVNLAIADECFLVGIPFLVATAVLGYWPFGNFLCKAYFTTTGINQFTSSLFLLVMSADRYLAVCHPINAPKWRTPLIAKVVALTAWTLSALLIVPIFMYANTLEIDNKINCNIFWPESETMSGDRIFMVYSFVLGFAFPLALILIFYILVIRRLRTVGPRKKPHSNNKSGDKDIPQIQQQSSRAKERKKSHRKVTKLVLTVVTVYFLCWAPYWVTQMGLIFLPHETNHSGTVLIIFLLAGCLSYSNSAMNPILYAFLSDNFKKSFKKACSCATNKDFNNTTMNQENSIFPRRKGSSYRRQGRKPSAPLTSATYAGTTCPELTTVGTSVTRSTMAQPSSIHQPSPPLTTNVPVSKLIPDLDESDGDADASDSLLALHSNFNAILVQTTEAGNLIGNRLTPSTQNNLLKPVYSDLVTVASVNETFVQDNGVVVTAL